MSSSSHEERAVAKIYNSYIAAGSIAAAWEVGLLDALKSQQSLDVLAFASKHDLDKDSTQSLAITLAVADVVKYSPDTATITPGSLFDETFRTMPMFHWLTLGSGGLFSRTQHLLRNENRQGGESFHLHMRDPVAVAYACRTLNKEFYDPVFWRVMDALPYRPRSVVDLGCGSGERLQQILKRFGDDTTGIGIDIAGPTIGFAEEEARKAGFAENRLKFSAGDARVIEPRAEFAEVDLLTSFLMGHDFWPRKRCIYTLRMLRELFPKVRRFLLGDETRGILPCAGSRPPVEQIKGEDVPIFALGLEFGHVLMDVYIPTMQEWYDVFEEGGWRCVKGHELQKPAFAVIFELEPLDD
ncbi:hypothetical protein N0V82_004683 [Gnomoniopsis sp. IMI 355080]|nr:hypothetical protein N0V82_004683 [Gnomoniopsis sp. IMI 355080]